jgi:hypothetical protein
MRAAHEASLFSITVTNRFFLWNYSWGWQYSPIFHTLALLAVLVSPPLLCYRSHNGVINLLYCSSDVHVVVGLRFLIAVFAVGTLAYYFNYIAYRQRPNHIWCVKGFEAMCSGSMIAKLSTTLFLADGLLLLLSSYFSRTGRLMSIMLEG